ncbi:hypothetical protein N7530_004065 [Penicillium desertorum]|uniref:Uncharacterized protein n=1 Tax=Penicillium desertorum TaxID=1303715 RepID=A0A9W9WXJ7_9EURO|nr:hypothetical protein N7530_004065 [Penicillium desertorum]
MIFKYQDQTFGGPESIVGFAIYEGEYYWLNCNGIDKVDYMLDCNLIIGSLNLVFVVRKSRSNIAPISVDLAYRRVYYTSEDCVKKIEVYIDRIALKPGTGVTFPCTPYIKGKGHSLPFGKFGYIVKRVYGDDIPEYKPLTTYLSSCEIKNRYLMEPLGYLLGGVNYTINRLYASYIGISLYEALYRKKPDLSNLRALGC